MRPLAFSQIAATYQAARCATNLVAPQNHTVVWFVAFLSLFYLPDSNIVLNHISETGLLRPEGA